MGIYNFKEFAEYIQEHITEYIENDLPGIQNVNLYIHKVVKNNGMILTSLEILEEGEAITPSIYLERYYDRYRETEDIDLVLKQIAQFYVMHKDDIDLNFDVFSDFDKAKANIIFRLVNQEWNQETLNRCPHMRWNDLAITFRWLAYCDEEGVASALITNSELERWQIELEDLYEIAMENTEHNFPVVLENLENIILSSQGMSEYERERLESKFAQVRQTADYVPMYVLTNKQRVNGATCMLYKDVLHRIAEQFENDFYILPSSVHEVILIEKKNVIDERLLKDMVLDANCSIVDRQEQLSNQVYIYNKQTRIVDIV